MSETETHDGIGIGDGAKPSTDESGRSLDAVFEILAARRRRYILYYLNDRPDECATFCELVDLVAAWERMTGIEPPSIHRRRVAASLRNDHLPALRDSGLIECEGDTVCYRVEDEFLQRLLSCAGITELP
jgi:DNA-binding transcriptional ArsR family regulator